jgi:hypothetical protein
MGMPSMIDSLEVGRPLFSLTVAKEKSGERRLPGILRLCSAKTISSNVRSGCSRLSARICWAYSSNGEVLPPRSIGSQVPS